MKYLEISGQISHQFTDKSAELASAFYCEMKSRIKSRKIIEHMTLRPDCFKNSLATFLYNRGKVKHNYVAILIRLLLFNRKDNIQWHVGNICNVSFYGFY